jgi:hypothetical protein
MKGACSVPVVVSAYPNSSVWQPTPLSSAWSSNSCDTSSRPLRIAFPPVYLKEGAGLERQGKNRHTLGTDSGSDGGGVEDPEPDWRLDAQRPLLYEAVLNPLVVEGVKLSHQRTDEFGTARLPADSRGAGKLLRAFLPSC